MSKKIKITDFKTKRINKFTGGEIKDYYDKSLCFDDQDPNDPKNCTLENSFVALDGTYMGDYATGWWYFKQDMLVCKNYPLGVGIVLKKRADKLEGLNVPDPQIMYVEGFYGYSHRGGCIFKIGDRLFDAKYKPVEKDYTAKEWNVYLKAQKKAIAETLKQEWCENEAQAIKRNRMSDFIAFNKRGSVIINDWGQAERSAINMSKYLG